jgi:streptogramin lyase
MIDTPSNDHVGETVLRPFEVTDQPPLPPVEPSGVVPASRSPAPEEELAESPEPPPIDPALTDEWSPPSDEDPVSAPPIPAPADDGETVTLPRGPFLVALGVVAVVLIGLFLLWQNAGDDATVVGPAGSGPTDVDDGGGSEGADLPPVSDGSSPADAEIADLSSQLASSLAEAAGLQAEVERLESRPAPAIPGERLRRIVVGADAKFVSSQPESIAVVGAFGALSMIDPSTNQVVSTSNVANAATRVMRTPTSVWLTNYTDNQILRFDPVTRSVVAAFPFEGPDGIEKDGSTLIVSSFDGGYVARVDSGTGESLQTVEVGGSPTGVLSHPEHGLWAAVFDTGEIVQIDRESFEVVQRLIVGAGPVSIGFDATHLWVTNHDEGTIAKVDPVSGEVVMTVVVGAGPTELVAVEGSVWATVTDDGSVVQVDANSGAIVSRTPLGGASAGGGPTGISYGNGAIWVAMHREQSVVRIEL